jgi:hypothetical protein
VLHFPQYSVVSPRIPRYPLRVMFVTFHVGFHIKRSLPCVTYWLHQWWVSGGPTQGFYMFLGPHIRVFQTARVMFCVGPRPPLAPTPRYDRRPPGGPRRPQETLGEPRRAQETPRRPPGDPMKQKKRKANISTSSEGELESIKNKQKLKLNVLTFSDGE